MQGFLLEKFVNQEKSKYVIGKYVRFLEMFIKN